MKDIEGRERKRKMVKYTLNQSSGSLTEIIGKDNILSVMVEDCPELMKDKSPWIQGAQ